jgi:gliding motility-associated-like protein
MKQSYSLQRLLLLLFFLFSASAISAQEICNNGIDDDNDGLADCQDPDCANFGTCPVRPSCSSPYVYYMPPVYGDKTASCDIFGSDDLVLTSLNGVANVSIFNGANVLQQQLLIPAANPFNYTLPNVGPGSDQVLKPSMNTVLNDAGYIITSDRPLQCSYRLLSRPNCNTYNQDLMQIHGNAALGYSFYALSQTDANGQTYTGAREKHFVSVMATENATTITFNVPASMQMEGSVNASVNNVTDWNGTRTVTLNAGESYIIASRNEDPNRTISGVRILANKPIVVNSGSHHTRNSQSGNADAGLTQLIPIPQLSNIYSIVDGGNPSSSKDYVVIVGVKNGTTLAINGVSGATDGLGNVMPATINAGQVVTYYFTNTQFATYTIQCSQVVYVGHVSSQTQGEYGLEILPSLNPCIGNKKVDFEKPGTNARAIVYVPTSGLSSLTFRGLPYTTYAAVVNGNQANPIPNTGYSFVVFENANILSTANNRVTCDQKMHVAVIAFTGGTGNYAYYSDYLKSVEVLDPISQQPTTSYTAGVVTPGTPITHCVNIGGCGANNSILSASADGGGTVSLTGPNCFTYTMNSTSPCFRETVTLQITNEFGATTNVCVGFNSSNTNVTITVQPPPTTVVCIGAALNLSVTASSPSGITSPGGYVWITPFATQVTGPTLNIPSVAANQGGTYTLTITDIAGCVRQVTYNVAVQNCNDYDNDGVANSADPDDDNDGILDVNESSGDSDGDGIADINDLDSDNDGIPDVIEAGGVDVNGDGILDGSDANSDGLIDNVGAGGLTNVDSDGDGRPNSIDLDADNDGIPDITEAGGIDANNDGRVDNFTDSGNGFADALDPAANGVPIFTTGADTNNDGRPNSYPNDNLDGDGTPNFLDVDSDNDGITDCTEAGGTDANGDGRIDGFADSDNDGLANSVDPNTSGTPLAIPDTDGDGLANIFDKDSDNDGITDCREAGGADANGDGLIDGFADSDGDGLANSVDPSTAGTPLPVPNSDGHGLPNYLDRDSDNDGIADIVEAGGTDTNGDGEVDNFADNDGDGISNQVDPGTNGTPLPVGDKDGDGRANYVDLDSDNDGIQDAIEAGGTDPDNDGRIGNGPVTDSDNDGLSDLVDSSTGGTPLGIPNFDGDVVPDYLDKDSDNDGITDAEEASGPANPGDVANDGVIGAGPIVDADGDGWADSVDPSQGGTAMARPDRDGDGKPNYLDLDSDADGIPDVLETRSPDADNDGFYGTGPATDADQDGLPDGNDPDFGGPNFSVFNQDREGDGFENYLDIDSDNDGIVDLIEGQPTQGFQSPTGLDTDNDGIDNAYDVNQNGVVCGYINTDGGSAPDWVDVDSDNDGIYDVVEAGLPDPDNNGWVGTGGGPFNTTSGPLPDADQDGLPDLADLVSGFDSDNSQTVNSLPDVQQPGGDRDWRDAPNNDGDAVNDNLDPDDDNDGIPDVVEGTGDFDLDGIPNNEDLDSDNDGIPDCVEAGGTDPDGNGLPGTGAVLADSDADGIPDLFDPSNGNGPLVPADTDGDGNLNMLDLDSDDDGIADVVEAGGSDPNNDGVIGSGVIVDTDADGLSDIVDTNNGGTPLTIPNTDGDTRPNYLDRDSDNDGIADVVEAGGSDPDGDGVIGTGAPADTDNDGLADSNDPDFNGSTLPNIDSDGDGRPNTMDIDSDNDGITDILEAGGVDTNQDGRIDGFADSDNDGLANTVDASTGGTALPNPNTDSDGVPNFLDIDSDNDGIVDVIEAQTTAGYIAPSNTDTDGDGLDNAYDPNNGGTYITPVNTDGATDGADYIDGDSDNDLIFDNIEAYDLNNDGIVDVVASGNDSDNDGLDDAYDSDGTSTTNSGLSDNNNQVPTGFPDLDNPGGDRDWRELLDSDNDGIADGVDADDDNDGVPDTVEGTADNDGDGIPNYLDLDSDNDGITDCNEAGGTDANGDGIIDGFTDTDNDGLADVVDPNNGGTPLPNADTDGDGVVDMLDLDSDNDGITDLTEAGGVDADGNGIVDNLTDTDEDGLADVVDTNNGGTALPVPDTDNDGNADYLDRDSDNDGITDCTEAGGTDANGDGIIDNFTDSDGNGLNDNTDGDNFPNSQLPTPDSDGDGNPDYLDLDSDGDGIADITEAGGTDTNGDGRVDAATDTDGDGLADVVDPSNGGTPLPVGDFDGDGVPNVVDLDSDNDGITDVTEAGFSDPDNDGKIGTGNAPDTDNDGWADAADNGTNTSANTANADGDSQPNYLDLDSDNDAIPDLVEAGGVDTDGNGVVDGTFTDTDGDGLSDTYDANNGGNAIANLDSDGDSVPNYRDLDSDNDGIADLVEAGEPDANNDGIVDGFTDTNNDGFNDATAASPTAATGADTNNDGRPDSQPTTGNTDNDFDNDGIPNYADLDSDNDGITDVTEAGLGALDSNNNGVLDGADTDGDGVANMAGVDNNTSFGGTFTNPVNTDASGGANYLDIDADNDGIVDNIEGQSTTGYIAPAGTDSDGDGIDDNYDNINGFGGAVITPVNTDGADTPDYIDTNSDNDAYSDALEGVDIDGSNTVNGSEPSASGNDADGDGLDDAFDTDDTQINPTNGQVPTSFPNVDGGSDRDWRVYENTPPTAVNDPVNVTVGSSSTVINAFANDSDPDPNQTLTLTILSGPSNGTATNNGNGNIGYTPNPAFCGTDTIVYQICDNGNPSLCDTALVIITVLPADTDNDGISDATEGLTADTDGDGIQNYRDIDSDNDGISDTYESEVTNTCTPAPARDTDSDGVPDHLDLDSDNDGLTDVLESGHGALDTNNDGVIDYSAAIDTDGDGMADATENVAPGDNDADGADDFRDLDADNDGISDVVEGGNGALDTNNDGIINSADTNGGDTDGDGITDAADGSTSFGDGAGNQDEAAQDNDGDGSLDSEDLDADNDGIADVVEGGFGALDTNNDGVVDGTDTDGDGIINVGPIDTNNTFNGNAGSQDETTQDNDGDGSLDSEDLDADNDGIADVVEGGFGALDTNNDGVVDGTDTDGDGIINVGPIDNNNTYGGDAGSQDETTQDNDGDGSLDSEDLDADNDGIADVVEGGLGSLDTDNDGVVDGIDSDGDGIINVGPIDTNNNYGGNAGSQDETTQDNDGDGSLDSEDLDADNDGMADVVEGGHGPLDANNDGVVDGTDTDGDGIINVGPIDTNTTYGGNTGSQDEGDQDFDGDGSLDNEDLDADNDGIGDVIEGGNGALDTNNDGVVDGNDTDDDGIINVGPIDTNTTYGGDTGTQNENANDVDGDGNLDTEDLDADNDGINDVDEGGNGDLDTNDDGVIDGNVDTDGDGILDPVDGDDGNYGDAPGDQNEDPLDPDNDDVINSEDLDSDGDGVNDVDEGGLGDLDGNDDGVIDNTSDNDNDGILDPADGDDNTYGDGNNGGSADPQALPDCDEDGVPNYLDTDPCGLTVPSGFSPNGDNINDLFVVKGLTEYPATKLQIVNRWGNLVYENTNYQNDWDGISNVNAVQFGDQRVPPGTYFYVIQLAEGQSLPDGKTSVTGFIEIRY